MNLRGNELLVQVDLFEQGREKLRLVEFDLIFPEHLAAVHNLAVPQVKEVQRDQRRLGVAGEDIHVVPLGGRHFLALLHFLHGGQQIAQGGGLLEARLRGRGFHARPQAARQVAMAPVQKQADVFHRGGVGIVGS